MAEDKEIKPRLKINRRQLLKGALGAATLAVVGGTSDESKELELSPIDKIRAFESHVGNAPLTFEQARLFAPLVIDFYRQGHQTLKSGSEIESSIYFFRTHLESYKEGQQRVTTFPDGTRIISTTAEQFTKDYPNSKLSGKDVDGLFTSMTLAYTLDGKTTREGNILILLDRVNDPNIDLRPEWKGPHYQFKGKGKDAFKKSASPAVRLRSLITHELVHLDTEKHDDTGIDSELNASFDRINDKAGKRFTSIEQSAFTFVLKEELANSTTLTRSSLEELIANYLMVKLATTYSLPYTLGHGHTPFDIANFENILRQSNISDEELYKMHQNNNVKEFMLRIARGAKNIELRSREEMFDFAMESFVVQPIDNMWKHLQGYFDGIEIEEK